jgi:sulfur relay (sulfurtransferase) complex TusBCD TusD component (DsrE family)
MKVAYIFATSMAASYKLATMILPQLEDGSHGAKVVGMFFFDDNLFLLRAGDPAGERLAKVAAEQGILLMVCDQCAVRRNLADGTLEQCGKGQVTARGLVAGTVAGCFPQLYAALAGSPPDQVITL